MDNVKKGYKGQIIWKLNSLVDPACIAALYEASQQGVQIDLIVRGICCLIPQVPGLSENIRVRSIVGRFLEHSRAYYFFNNGKEVVLVSSADIMPRNLDRRVEIAFPIKNKKIKKEIFENILLLCLADNVKSRMLLPTGKYVCIKSSDKTGRISVQDKLMEMASKSV
jgi:polyphosphate kinase